MTRPALVERSARLLEATRRPISEDFDPLGRLVDHLTGDDASKGRDLMANVRWKAAQWLVGPGDEWLDAFADEVGLDFEDYADDEALARTLQNEYLLEIDWRDWDLPDAMYEAFKDYAEKQSWFGRDPETPSWAFMQFRDRLDGAWLVHFSDRAGDICTDGFEKGVMDPTKLGLTGQLHPADREREGYNFAFTVGEVDDYGQYSRSHEWKYGSEAVVFQADAVKVWHFGDEEPQAIFWGPSARNMTCIRRNPQDEWYPRGEPDQTFRSPGAAAQYVARTS